MSFPVIESSEEAQAIEGASLKGSGRNVNHSSSVSNVPALRHLTYGLPLQRLAPSRDHRLAGLAMTVGRDCYDLCVPPMLLGAVVVVGYLPDDIWRVVTADQDAHSLNDRTERLRATRVDFKPALRIAPAGAATRSRLDVRVLRAEF